MATLKKVAAETGYSYTYVKMVNCGLKDNVKIIQAICMEKKNEIKEIKRRIKNIERKKEKNHFTKK